MRDLKRTQQPHVKQIMWRQACDVFAVHQDTARGRLKNARDHIEKSCFSSAVWSDQSGDRALLDRQAGAVDRVKTAEVFVYVVNDDHMSIPESTSFRVRGFLGAIQPGEAGLYHVGIKSVPVSALLVADRDVLAVLDFDHPVSTG